VRFWDSSAIVPLLVTQPISTETDRWFVADPAIAVWTCTTVEVVSALRRLVREATLAEAVAVDAERRLDELVRACHVVIDVEGAKARARRLLRVHPLRAADALQLAAALAWADGESGAAVLHTFDARLGQAARREGFQVVPEPP
jgi:predicted nucleic acid-binding protein